MYSNPGQNDRQNGESDYQAPILRRAYPPLSETEKRVKCLLLKRLTERQVAEHMGRSHNTVHVHVRNIYRKLGIRTREELFVLAKSQTETGQ